MSKNTTSRGLMLLNEFDNRVRLHWNHFLLLENDFKTILRYIEPTDDNQNAYGPELVKLILSCGSEVDVVLKDLYECIDPKGFWKEQIKQDGFDNKLNISHYKTLVTHLREWPFKHARVAISVGDWSVIPWESWWDHPSQSPEWWTSYNDVKHNRGIAYNRATLFNAFSALAALFVAVVDLARVTGVSRMTPYPMLLEFTNPTFGETSSAEMVGSTLYMHPSISFNINVGADVGAELASTAESRIELATNLRNMDERERLEFLRDVENCT